MDTHDLIPLIESAAARGIHERTVYRLLHRRGIPRYRVPGDTRSHIRRADLDRLLEPEVMRPLGQPQPGA